MAAAFAVSATSCRSSSTLATLPACVNLVQDNGARWSLPYAGQHCTAPLHPQLPERLYDSVASWAFNAQDVGILPMIEEVRIRSRLATLDTRSGFAFSIHSDELIDYKWVDHLGMVHALLCDGFHDDGAVAALFDKPLAGFGFTGCGAANLDPSQRRLWPWRRRALLNVLATVETRLRDDAQFRVVSKSVEDAVMEVPEYAAIRRANFSRFRVE